MQRNNIVRAHSPGTGGCTAFSSHRFPASWIVLLVFAFVTGAIGSRCLAQPQQQQNSIPPMILFRNLYDHHRAAGHDVSKAEKLNMEAKQAFQRGDRAETDLLLKKAIAELDNLGPRPGPARSPNADRGSHPDENRTDETVSANSSNAPSSSQTQTAGKGDSLLIRPYSNAPFMLPAKMKGVSYDSAEPPPSGAFAYNDSPFGIYGPYEIMFDDPVGATEQELNDYLLDMGVTWVQELPLWLAKLPTGINLYTRIGREGGTVPSANIDFDRYSKALREKIAKLKHRVKVYEVCTEPDGVPPPTGWKGIEKEYAEFLRVTRDTVKKECPECIVVFGGLTGVGARVDTSISAARFLDKVLAAGAAGAFDAFEFKQHMHNADDYTAIGKRMKLFFDIMARHGVDLSTMPVYLEIATHDGSARFPEKSHMSVFNRHLKEQSEAEQAASLVKTYVYSLAQGVDKIFWDMVVEHHRFGGSENNPFDLYGTVHNPYNADGKKGKKLAYYSYKKMIELLGRADFSSLITMIDKNGLYLYRFNTPSGYVWVAWSDNGSRQVEMDSVRSSSTTLIKSVPGSESGQQVADYSTAFSTTSKDVSTDGRLAVEVGYDPVYIMEK